MKSTNEKGFNANFVVVCLENNRFVVLFHTRFMIIMQVLSVGIYLILLKERVYCTENGILQNKIKN